MGLGMSCAPPFYLVMCQPLWSKRSGISHKCKEEESDLEHVLFKSRVEVE